MSLNRPTAQTRSGDTLTGVAYVTIFMFVVDFVDVAIVVSSSLPFTVAMEYVGTFRSGGLVVSKKSSGDDRAETLDFRATNANDIRTKAAL